MLLNDFEAVLIRFDVMEISSACDGELRASLTKLKAAPHAPPHRYFCRAGPAIG